MKLKMLIIFLLFVFMKQTFTYVELTNFQKDTITVEVKGEVNKQGVYEVSYHTTIEEVLELCEGVSENADLSSISLQKEVNDNDIIVVPEIQEMKKISINSADLNELDTLPGIGPSTAQRIIDYRQLHSFTKLEDIMNVKGIKQKLFNKIKDYICL